MGDVAIGDSFVASLANFGADKFDANLYIHIFDDNPFDGVGSNTLLQSLQYHADGAEPMYFGDLVGSVTLVGYEGEIGSWGI
jgi:hypothetical protein